MKDSCHPGTERQKERTVLWRPAGARDTGEGPSARGCYIPCSPAGGREENAWLLSRPPPIPWQGLPFAESNQKSEGKEGPVMQSVVYCQRFCLSEDLGRWGCEYPGEKSSWQRASMAQAEAGVCPASLRGSQMAREAGRRASRGS